VPARARGRVGGVVFVGVKFRVGRGERRGRVGTSVAPEDGVLTRAIGTPFPPPPTAGLGGMRDDPSRFPTDIGWESISRPEHEKFSFVCLDGQSHMPRGGIEVLLCFRRYGVHSDETPRCPDVLV
jgi:hypothetical protein